MACRPKFGTPAQNVKVLVEGAFSGHCENFAKARHGPEPGRHQGQEQMCIPRAHCRLNLSQVTGMDKQGKNCAYLFMHLDKYLRTHE